MTLIIVCYFAKVMYILFVYFQYGIVGRQRNPSTHYNDVIMSAMASQLTGLTIVYSNVYSAQIKENIKAPRHRWIPRTKDQ